MTSADIDEAIQQHFDETVKRYFEAVLARLASIEDRLEFLERVHNNTINDEEHMPSSRFKFSKPN